MALKGALLLLVLAVAACVTIPNPEPRNPFERPRPHMARLVILRF